jgi:hypothetical protein
MQVVPLSAVPSQSLTANLGNQICQINVYQKEFWTDNNEAGTLAQITPMFLDLYVNNSLIIGGVLCLNGTLIVRDTYLGFTGDLAFYDTQGTNDPTYDGLGTRYFLVYLAPSDI